MEKGDLVAFEERDGVITLVPQKIVSLLELGDVGDILEKYGVSLEDLIESGREQRAEILNDIYGYPDADVRE